MEGYNNFNSQSNLVQGFGFTWSATKGGDGFKPDAKNAPQVPCDEYFEGK
jgi:hypothetical protein